MFSDLWQPEISPNLEAGGGSRSTLDEGKYPAQNICIFVAQTLLFLLNHSFWNCVAKFSSSSFCRNCFPSPFGFIRKQEIETCNFLRLKQCLQFFLYKVLFLSLPSLRVPPPVVKICLQPLRVNNSLFRLDIHFKTVSGLNLAWLGTGNLQLGNYRLRNTVHLVKYWVILSVWIRFFQFWLWKAWSGHTACNR